MKHPDDNSRTVLIHSPNWLGDVIMALPAFRAWRDANSNAKVFILAKKSVAGLWKYVRDVDGVIILTKEKGATSAAVAAIREAKCTEAILLPQSFRSAWIVWRSGISSIRGTSGQFRSFMISDKVSIYDLDKAHQVREYLRIMGLDDSVSPLSPADAIDTSKLPPVPNLGISPENAVIILPGAARGDSKRWPAENFADAAISVMSTHAELQTIVCGTPDEAPACNAVSNAIAAKFPERVSNICGKTSLAELAAIIAKARAVCCNDSGGMHLSTAMGTPVVAIFGITDPSKTGPLGKSKVVAAKGFKVSRAIPRTSPTATLALISVKPEEVIQALEEFLTK